MQDIEQLKLILETIGQTTESAKWVLLAWLGVDLLKTTIGAIITLVAIVIIVRAVTGLVFDNIFGRVCRDMVIDGQIGTYINERERDRVQKIIKLGLEAEKNQ